MASISLRGIEKRYAEVRALLGCDLDIGDHEFVVLVGPSGSGKTTLLRIIAGLEDVTDGEVYFDDVVVNDIDVGDRDIAMVFQNYGLYPHMNVHDNMAFGLRRRAMRRPEIDKRVREAAQMLGIAPMLKRRPKQLSGGQRQRVALGRAIVRDPSVFLLDEPLSNLDAHLRVQMRAEILRVHRAVSATAVYVTHDQVEAMTMGDRVAVMHEGRIHQVGTPEQLYDHPVNRFVAGFIGTPAMGFLRGTVKAEGDRLAAVGDGVRVELPQSVVADVDASEVDIGIRPELLRPVQAEADQDGGSTVRGTVSMVEPLGHEQYVHVDVGAAALTARVSRDVQVRPEEPITFAVDGARCHLFDPESGEVLGG
ncbi:MAG: ABC transporter ATP-binding protein [Nocardioidaceae bacterium]